MTTTMTDEMLDLIAMRDEPLEPELEDFLEDCTSFPGMLMLRHPLVYDVPFMLPGMVNRRLAMKKKALRKALLNHDLHSIVWLHERAYRTGALVEHIVGLDEHDVPQRLIDHDSEVRELAASVWRDSENLDFYEDEWRAMLDTGGQTDVLLLDDSDGGFEALPDVLTVYRGDVEDGGMSWSLEERVARWFANRFDQVPILAGTVHKRDVVGYLVQRNEAEVIVLDDSKVTITWKERG